MQMQLKSVTLAFCAACFIALTIMYRNVRFGTVPRLDGKVDPIEYRVNETTITKQNICYVQSQSRTTQNLLGCMRKNEGELFKSVDFGNVSSCLTFLGFDNFTECQSTLVPGIPEVPVIVSGVSNNHYKEAVALCDSINKTLRRNYKDVQLHIYDLGIPKARDRENLRRFCGCELRIFPFSYFPKHVSNIRGYTWKPLIISLMLKEFPFVMWVDTSIRFDSNKTIATLFKRSRTCDIQQLSESEWTIGETSDPKTLQFLNQTIQDFLNATDVESGWGVYVRTKFMMERIMKPWVKCALSYGCMLTDTYSFATQCKRPTASPRKAGLCHRFDQTVLGIILTNLYRERINNVLFGEKVYGDVLRGTEMSIPPSSV